MPRAGWKRSDSDRRLPDLVSVGLLERVFPPEVVDGVIAECGRTEQRLRSLPARSMAYFAMGMALHAERSYEGVLALISDGLAWADREDGTARLTSKPAIFHARERLGCESMWRLFERVAQPLAAKEVSGCWLAGWRLVAIDGTCLDLAEGSANDEHFGRPGVMKGERSAFPQDGLVVLAECAGNALPRELLGRLTKGKLCLADSGFYSFEAWQQASQTGADLLWRVKNSLGLG